MKMCDSKFCQCLYFTSNALARKVEKLANESWKKIGLTASHAYLLKLVIEEPGIQAGQLSEQLHLTPSTITRLLEKLEEKNLLSRSMTGKITQVYPTAGGKALHPQIRKCIEEFYQHYVQVLGKEESRQFVENMAVMADKLGG